jgi:hypothetical protein
MMSSSKMVLVAAGLAVAVLGCGKKSAGGAGTDAGQLGTGVSGAGGTAVAGSGGSGGGSMSVAGSGGVGGAGGRAAVAPVMCGSANCKASSAFLTACCMDAATNTCGVMATGIGCALPGVPDPRCPNRPAAMGLTAKGCCNNNQCGGTLMGLPCIVPKTDGGAAPLACDAAGADAGS